MSLVKVAEKATALLAGQLHWTEMNTGV